MNPIVWVIDDDASIRFVFDRGLQMQHIPHRLFESGDDALAALSREKPDVIVADIRMPGISGLDLVDQVRQIDSTIPFIIITAHSDLNTAVTSYEHGIFEYVPKPFDINVVVSVIRRAVNHHMNLIKAREPQNSLAPTQMPSTSADSPTDEIIGKSPSMQEVFKAIGRVAKTNLSVMINGEVGTGRELVAKALHQHSDRSDYPFVTVSMSSMPSEDAERELFGDDNDVSALSAIERAENGSLYINEICDMPRDAQTRLLNFLQSGQYTKIGAKVPVKANIRLMVSSSKNLEALVRQGVFIADLYYRLNVFNINMPPLRERNNDIPMLAKHFLSTAAAESGVETKKLTSEVLVFLCRQSWPGNVRQLKNLCKYLTVMVTGHDIQMVDLPSDFIQPHSSRTGTETSINGNTHEDTSWQSQLRAWAEIRLKAGEQDILNEAIPEFERVMIQTTLDFTGKRKQEAARLLGWGRNTLTRKLKELNMSDR